MHIFDFHYNNILQDGKNLSDVNITNTCSFDYHDSQSDFKEFVENIRHV